MRAFVAVNLSIEARAAIQSALENFPVKNPPWRWVTPDSWHITLKFLGETETARVSALTQVLGDVARAHPAFEMTLGAFGGFPNLRNPRVLFYSVVKGARDLELLAGDVDAALEKGVGLARETRAFHAHATVARVKDPLSASITSRLATVPPLTGARSGVHSFELMESRLQRAGAVYSVVKEFALP